MGNKNLPFPTHAWPVNKIVTYWIIWKLMPHSHFRYLSNQLCWNYTDARKFKAVTGTLFPQGHSWQIRPILLIKHYKTSLLSITWIEVSRNYETHPLCSGRTVAATRLKTSGLILVRCFSSLNAADAKSPPLPQLLKWEMSLFDRIKKAPQKHLQLHCMGK